MLTRRNLQSIATIDGIPLYTVEREYIQTLFLYLLYKHTTLFLFKVRIPPVYSEQSER
jgi:hypothetical protein